MRDIFVLSRSSQYDVVGEKKKKKKPPVKTHLSPSEQLSSIHFALKEATAAAAGYTTGRFEREKYFFLSFSCANNIKKR